MFTSLFAGTTLEKAHGDPVWCICVTWLFPTEPLRLNRCQWPHLNVKANKKSEEMVYVDVL